MGGGGKEMCASCFSDSLVCGNQRYVFLGEEFKFLQKKLNVMVIP